MSALAIVLACLAIPATLYQLLKLAHIVALSGRTRSGYVYITPGLRVAIAVTIGIQMALVLALTGVIA